MNRNLLTKMIIKAMTIKGHADVRQMHNNTLNAKKKNEKLLMKILRINAECEYGKKYHYSEIKTIADYREKVPVTTFSDYEGYIARMIENNESDLITSLPVIGYAQSSGSVGVRKFVPITQREVNIYTKYTVTRMLALADTWHKQHRGYGLIPGRGMFTCPSFDDTLPNGLLCSNIADVAAKQLGFIYPYILNVPFHRLFSSKEADFRYINSRFALEDENSMYVFCVFMKAFTDIMRYIEKNWETIVSDIETGTVSELSKASPEALEKLKTVVIPKPDRAAHLRAEFSKGFDETIIRRIWPNMSVICGIGTSTFSRFSEIARNYTEGVPYDYSIYGASEGLFAAADALESEKQLLLVDSCFYEFVPIDDETKILLIDELEIGKEYEIIITNQAGLYRYKCGDVIRVVDYINDCPYVVFAYRKGQLLNLTGEKTTEEHMKAVVSEIEKAADIKINNWTVYNCLEEHPYHYVLLAENKSGIDLSKYSELADRELRRINIRYKHFVENDELGAIVVKNQEPGSQAAWAKTQQEKGVPVSQIKPVRILDTKEKMNFFIHRVKE